MQEPAQESLPKCNAVHERTGLVCDRDQGHTGCHISAGEDIGPAAWPPGGRAMKYQTWDTPDDIVPGIALAGTL